MGGSDILSGTLDILVLQTLSSGALHGYGISREIRKKSGDVLKVGDGVLYPALHRLEAGGYLGSEWGRTSTGREAKFYRLTPSGRRKLERDSARWSERSGAVAAILGEKPA